MYVCISATPIADWTPSSTDGTKGGNLWVQFMVPLLPMTFKAALWDQVRKEATHRILLAGTICQSLAPFYDTDIFVVFDCEHV